jgi:hypothetical protein
MRTLRGMGRRWPHSVAISAVLLLLTASACSGNPDPPPVPTETRVPAVIGRLVGFAPDGHGYLLDDGTVIDLGLSGSDAPKAKLLSAGSPHLPDGDRRGGLLLFGEDAAGRFYAAASPSGSGDVGCDILRGQGFIESDRVHLSTGLALPFASGMTRINDRDPRHVDPTWLLDFDPICIDEDGKVTSIHQLPLGV